MPIMTVSFVIFPTGAPVPGLPSISVSVNEGSPFSIGAGATVPAGSTNPGYAFGFWVVDGVMSTAQAFNGPAAPAHNFAATAWYFGEGGTPQPVLTTWAFSTDTDTVLTGTTPIGTVVPPGVWAGGEATAISTAEGQLQVTAAPAISGSGLFVSWLTVGAPPANGPTFLVPAGAQVEAIAFYSLPNPDPCAEIRAMLNDITPGDFPNFPAYVAARNRTLQQLVTCEARNGEKV